MVMLDTNIILRYLLNDDERMASEAERIQTVTQGMKDIIRSLDNLEEIL